MKYQATDTEFMVAFGAHVRKLIEARGMSLRGASAMLDMDYSQLWKVCSGQQNVTISTVMVLATGLGVSHRDMFDFDFKRKA
ncbi:MAG: XRE family transcriptional regulator [Sphingobacteriaceae bacterium]|nr:MAG: XRE family transcriptional regulator [Sphingobacteriaceae bacterium]